MIGAVSSVPGAPIDEGAFVVLSEGFAEPDLIEELEPRRFARRLIPVSPSGSCDQVVNSVEGATVRS